MLNHQHHINYTAGDIQQYLQGKMTPAQMHQLEKEALHNPFLAEAIEGFEQNNTQQTFDALAELKAEFAKNNQEPLVLIKSTTIKWWRMAAAIFAISTTVALTYFLSNNNKITNTQIAENNTIKNATNTVIDSNTNELQQAPITITNAQQQYADVAIEKRQNISVQDKLVDTNSFIYKPTLTNPANAPIQNDVTTTERNTNVKAMQEKAVDPAKVYSNNALSNANAANDITINKQAQTEVATNQRAIETDEIIKSKAVQPAIDNKDDRKEMKETIVVGYGVKKNAKQSNASTAKMDSTALAGKVSGVQVASTNTGTKKSTNIVATPQPSIGWQAYNEYLKNNNQLSNANKKLYKNKQVVLNFIIKQSGKPAQIKIIESVCPACDEEAIRLLKEGPAWLPSADKKNKYTISISL